jgi:hypothetical protein
MRGDAMPFATTRIPSAPTRNLETLAIIQPREKSMSKSNSVVAIYPSHTAAEVAIKELQRSGFDLRKLPIDGD